MICSYLLHGCDVIRILKLCIEERGVSQTLKNLTLSEEKRSYDTTSQDSHCPPSA